VFAFEPSELPGIPLDVIRLMLTLLISQSSKNDDTWGQNGVP